MQQRKRGLLLILLGLTLGAGGISLDRIYDFGADALPFISIPPTEAPADPMPAKKGERRAWVITPKARAHILEEHLHGAGKPCKSEFPENWDEEMIMNAIANIAVNDNLNWQQEDNGYYVAEQNYGRVKLRIVKDKKNERVITGYPVTVTRNPCPTSANDNNPDF